MADIFDEQIEARRLLKAIDCFDGRLSDWEKHFIADLIDNWEGDLTPKQIKTIERIADKHNIL
jgi:hypothetical protein